MSSTRSETENLIFLQNEPYDKLYTTKDHTLGEVSNFNIFLCAVIREEFV